MSGPMDKLLNTPVFQPIPVTPGAITEATEKVRRDLDAAVARAKEDEEIANMRVLRDGGGLPYAMPYPGGPLTIGEKLAPGPTDERVYDSRGHVNAPMKVSWSQPSDPTDWDPIPTHEPAANLSEAAIDWAVEQIRKRFVHDDEIDPLAVTRDIARGT